MSDENQNSEASEVEGEEATEPKKSTKRSRKTKPDPVQVFDKVSIQRQAVPGGSAPVAVFSTPMPPKVGDKIEIKTNKGQGYDGICAEVEEIDGQFVVAFTKEGLKPA